MQFQWELENWWKSLYGKNLSHSQRMTGTYTTFISKYNEKYDHYNQNRIILSDHKLKRKLHLADWWIYAMSGHDSFGSQNRTLIWLLICIFGCYTVFYSTANLLWIIFIAWGWPLKSPINRNNRFIRFRYIFY